MTTLVLILITLLAFSYGRYLYKLVIENQSMYELYQIRDDLRRLAIEGHVNPKQSSFQSLDGSISRSISILEQITLLKVIVFNLAYNASGAVSERSEKEVEEISSNKKLKDILKRYNTTMTMYVVYQHGFSRHIAYPFIKLITGGGRVFLRMFRGFKKVLNRSVQNMSFGGSPEVYDNYFHLNAR